MKNIILPLIKLYMRLSSTIFPKAASKKAQDIFFTPKKHPSKSWEIISTEHANSVILAGGIHCLVWGNHEGESILLMHGWEGRASQMSVFLPYLASKYKLIAINAPAHGLSEGDQSHPHKFIKAIFTAQEHFGAFHAIIGHSMGGGCAVYAALEQLKVKKVVSIAGPSNFESAVSTYANFIGLRSKAFQFFMSEVETVVQLPFSQLNLASRIKNLSQTLLVIHDEQDLEVPFSHGSQYIPEIVNGEFFATQGLGHRKIMQSEQVLRKVADFIG